MLRLAAVDIGANSIRLKIARVVRKRLEVLHEDREVVRLGEGVFRTGTLDPAAMELAVRVLRRFQKAAQQHAVQRTRVVATSPLRDATNASALQHWVHSAIGWRVEVVSGVEEGRLIHLGVMANIRTSANRVLLVDLGGGSCELTVSYKGQIERIHSLPLGAVRLTRQFLQHDPPSPTELEQLRSFIREELGRLRRELTLHKINVAYATSGTANAISDLWQNSRNGDGLAVPRAGVLRLSRKLSSLSVDQRRSLRGIGPRRSEIIVAGAHVFAELMSELHLSNFRFLPYGMRDGILAQMAAEREDIGLRRQLENQRQNAILKLAGHYAVDLRFSTRVAEHAERLFKLLAPVHELPPEYAKLLHAAAVLHEVGAFISRAGRRRHAYYILAHSELLGFSQPQRRVIAAIARYLGKSKITPASRPVRLLAPDDRPLLPRAVVLMRLAAAMEQGRRGAVLGIRARVQPSRVHLTLTTRPSGAELEMWALERERAYFLEVFGRELDCAEV